MKSVTHPRVNKIREKIKSVASVLSVIHFERVRKSPKALEHCDYLWSFIHHHVLITSRRTDQDASGTVFQTAFLLAFIIPRLRPGLLSLRSVQASSLSLLDSFRIEKLIDEQTIRASSLILLTGGLVVLLSCSQTYTYNNATKQQHHKTANKYYPIFFYLLSIMQIVFIGFASIYPFYGQRIMLGRMG